jgi:hypothetical protein
MLDFGQFSAKTAIEKQHLQQKFIGHHNIQQNDTQHDDIWHNDTQHNWLVLGHSA